MVDEDTDLRASVQRLHGGIVDALRSRGRDPYATPVTVAEIYQDLTPYRAVRGTLGFEMNADYEHAIVRLLSGIDGLARLDPSTARERLRKELDSPNPDVTLYRQYAACDVAFNPAEPDADWVEAQLDDDAVPEHETVRETTAQHAPDWSALASLSAHDTELEEDETEDAEEADATDDSWTVAETAQTDAPAGVETHASRTPDDSVEVTPCCVNCDSGLPTGRKVRFCPYCGADQTMHPCPACGELLEPGWSFCVACGTSIASRE